MCGWGRRIWQTEVKRHLVLAAIDELNKKMEFSNMALHLFQRKLLPKMEFLTILYFIAHR